MSADHRVRCEHHVDCKKNGKEEPEKTRPKVNPIFLWTSQREQEIVEVRCEDYDKWNRIKLRKTAQGWRSIPRTASNAYAVATSISSETASVDEGKTDRSRDSIDRDFDKYSEKDSVRLTDKSTDMEDLRGRRSEYNGLICGRKRKRSFKLSTDRMSSEGRMKPHWKSKRRRKMKKYRRRKRITRSEEDMADEDDDDEMDEKRKSGYTSSESKSGQVKSQISSACQKRLRIKFSDLEKMQTNKLLQPRVVLEQLHLSQLPKRVHKNFLKTKKQEGKESERGNDEIEEKEQEVEVEKRRKHEDEDETEDRGNDEENNDADDEGIEDDDDDEDERDVNERIKCDKNPAVMNKNDFRKILDNLSKVDDYSNAKVEKVVNKNDRYEKMPPKRPTDGKNLIETMQLDEPISGDVGSGKLPAIITSLSCFIDENNELIYGKKPRVISNDVRSTEKKCDNNASEVNDETLLKNDSLSWNNSTTAIEVSSVSSISEEKEANKPNDNPNDSLKILKVLQNTPGISVSIAIKPQPLSQVKKESASSRHSPDSQSQPTEDSVKMVFTSTSTTQEKSSGSSANRIDQVSKICITVPNYKHWTQTPELMVSPSNTVFPLSRKHMESPESTVNCQRPEECNNDFDKHHAIDMDDCDFQVLEDLQKQNEKIRRQRSSKAVTKDIPQLRPLDDRSVTGSLKPWNSVESCAKNRNNEAQAKLSNVYYLSNHSIDNLKSRGSVVSPQPSGIPYSNIHAKKAPSGYLERLLPSPPCSVSCSEDVNRNDLTLRSILASPRLAKDLEKQQQQTEDFRNQDEGMLTAKKTANSTQKPVMTAREHLPRIREDLHFPNSIFSKGEIFNKNIISNYLPSKRSAPLSWNSHLNAPKRSSYHHSVRSNLTRTYGNYQQTYATSRNPEIQLDPASQLRELLRTSSGLIPDPLLVPRDYLPTLAASPSIGIPQLLTTRPDLRLPEALSNSELLKDPNLLVISLAHLQHVLDYGDAPYTSVQRNSQRNNEDIRMVNEEKIAQTKPKLVCKPIGSLMSSPMDLSNNRKSNPCPPLLRVRSGLLKQESEVTSTANSPDDTNLWHPLFGSQKRHPSWHRTTLAS